MPGAKKLTWKDARNIDAVEACGVGPEVRYSPADQDLRQEEQADDDRVLQRRTLARRRMMRQHRGSSPGIALPSEEVETAERKEYCRDSAKQHQEAHRAPENCIRSWDIPRKGVVRKIIRV